ncbi:MG2 domain-containing protein [Adhaeribacter pallidiroseus]|uniref:Macroglobulin domain-containing protein n=1 Tax=Adhaeribacter pallidiroseus TaxID=2072847 RepID=A0A369QL70_9BACT|nr:MG2 domain-containing protein [Adhaeribacter pallidiroseus]RDC65122.1 hypothetical protein AHMF7616_03752 [Adhaeribacter pallidiroseus]
MKFLKSITSLFCTCNRHRTFLKFFILLGFLKNASVYGQSDSLKSINRPFNQYQEQNLTEKLFLHVDRPVYLAGETMWFKVYAVDGTFQKPLALSKIAYIEILDKEQKPVLQGKVALTEAMGQGSFVLPATLASGNYLVRAYTNWMQNFNPEYFFQSSITIVNTFTNLGIKPGKDSIAYDIQFFPEGGNLVKGIASKVAFKITDRFGQGQAAEGSIQDKQGNSVATFKTQKFGMGQFTFIPSEAIDYQATIKLAHTTVTQNLPKVYEQGYTMHLDQSNPEQLKISVQTNYPDQAYTDVFLFGHARQKALFEVNKRLNNGQAEFLINKNDLAEGINHFTIFNDRKQPLCERLFFQQPRQKLIITTTTDEKNYTTRDKVTVELTTANPSQAATPADVSMAVYRLDSLPASALPDINSYLWLTSDLRGNIENPAYYFNSTDPEATLATDNLMLTQGWRRFKWESVFLKKSDSLQFIPELNGHFIRGSLTDRQTGRPIPNMSTFLGSPSRLVRLYHNRTKENGAFQFEVKDFYGPREIVLQTSLQQDSLYRFEVENPFTSKKTAWQVPAFTLSEKFKSDIEQRHVQMQVQNTFFKKYTNRYKPTLTDSLAFYGRPDEKYMLDDFTRFKVMEEVMREYVPGVQVRIRKDGFHFMVFDNVNRSIFPENPMVLLDGVPVFNINKIMAMDPLKIQKLEVITSRYFQGTTSYNGLVSFSTYKGDLDGYEISPHAFVLEYEGLQYQREFYAPRYETAAEKQSRLPDLRNLLYWNPQIKTTKAGNQKLEFYTSDKAGKYLIQIQGLSGTGLAGSTNFTFEVKQAL